MGRWSYIDDTGNARNRQRTPDQPCRIDLDVMTREDLRAFLNSWPRGMSLTEWARTVFPSRPIGFRDTAHSLYVMARMKYCNCTGAFEARYKKLPEYAQWRQRFTVRATVAPGKTFRKRPPRR